MKVSIFFSTKTRDTGCYRAEGKVFNADMARELFDGGGYKFAADVDMNADTAEDAVEDAYVASQNIHSPWHNPPCRSTMVGDIFVVGEEKFIVASLGFDKL